MGLLAHVDFRIKIFDLAGHVGDKFRRIKERHRGIADSAFFQRIPKLALALAITDKDTYAGYDDTFVHRNQR